MKFKWTDLLNIEIIGYFILAIIVLYFVCKNWKKGKKYDFMGVGKSGYDLKEGKRVWKRNRRKIPKRYSKLFSKRLRASKPRSRKGRPKFNKHEERCREIFQMIYGRKFKSVRPNWLKNPVTNRNLELDGFCESIRTPLGMGLAFEYDGEQHAKYNKHFHRSGPDEFLYQVKKDSWKDHTCKKRGVFLIRIPHVVAYEDLERYIVDKLDKLRLLPIKFKSRYRSLPNRMRRPGSFTQKDMDRYNSILDGMYK